MPVIDHRSAPCFELGAASFVGLAAPSRGARETSAWRLRLVPDGQPGLVHRVTREEVFVAIAGRADVVGIDLVEVNPGVDTPGGATAYLAAHLLVEALDAIAA